MNKDIRLILEGIQIIIGEMEPTIEIIPYFESLKKALAPQSQEMGYEEDIEDTQSCSKKSVEEKE